MGLHAGRKNRSDVLGRKGTEAATDGCIRTSDEAMQFLQDLHEIDPVQSMNVIQGDFPTEIDNTPTSTETDNTSTE